jgi:ABC-type dipeptide/oligopeptide/nickel transport system permease subunit
MRASCGRPAYPPPEARVFDSYRWLIYPRGIAIIITCITVNVIGDALREAFETQVQRR